MTCTIAGCENPIRIHMRGWCAAHYRRWQRRGDPTLLAKNYTPRGSSPAERFEVKVKRTPTCWLWIGARSPQGRLVTSCVHGHLYTPETTGRRKNGRRYCLACWGSKARASNAAATERPAEAVARIVGDLREQLPTVVVSAAMQTEEEA